jgi:hypothetical protein
MSATIPTAWYASIKIYVGCECQMSTAGRGRANLLRGGFSLQHAKAVIGPIRCPGFYWKI